MNLLSWTQLAIILMFKTKLSEFPAPKKLQWISINFTNMAGRWTTVVFRTEAYIKAEL